MIHPLKAALAYYRLRSSWLGDGGQPVPIDQAITRSNICKTCPLNQPHPLWETLTQPAAAELRNQIQLKTQLHLAVPGEDGLRVCSACLCNLPLKVWAPLKHILATTPLEGLAEQCWILEEAKQQ